VSFRFRDGGQLNQVPVADAVDAVLSWVRHRENSSPSERNFSVGNR
jgi:threonyl-tRNA synthetase